MLEEYNNIIAALQLVHKCTDAVIREEGIGVMSPAWQMLVHVEYYLRAKADFVLRGE